MPTICGLEAQLDRDEPDRVVGQGRGGRGHLARHEQDLHDVGRRLPDLLGDRLRGGAPHDLQGRHGRRGGPRLGLPPARCGGRRGREARERVGGWRARPASRWRAPRPRPPRPVPVRCGLGVGSRRGHDDAIGRRRGCGRGGRGLRPSRLGLALVLGLGLRGAGGGSSTSRRFGASVALPPDARRRGTRSSGTLDEADLPATPICSSVPSSSLLVTPSSFASS